MLDQKLVFEYHVNDKIKKAMKGTGLLQKLQPILPRRCSLTIYKSFIRPRLDYSGVVYDQPSNDFSDQVSYFWYNANIFTSQLHYGTC